ELSAGRIEPAEVVAFLADEPDAPRLVDRRIARPRVLPRHRPFLDLDGLLRGGAAGEQKEDDSAPQFHDAAILTRYSFALCCTTPTPPSAPWLRCRWPRGHSCFSSARWWPFASARRASACCS